MASISMGVDAGLLKQLQDTLNGIPKEMRKQLAIAVNKTAAGTKSGIAKDVSKKVNLKQKTIKETLEVKRAKGDVPEATVVLKKTAKISLREYGAKQNGKGVSYKVGKGSRGFVAGAFQGPRPGVPFPKYKGTVFKRVGKSRLPIVKLHGPSPWGVFVKNDMEGPTKIATKADLRKQVVERIRFLKLKKAGVI